MMREISSIEIRSAVEDVVGVLLDSTIEDAGLADCLDLSAGQKAVFPVVFASLTAALAQRVFGLVPDLGYMHRLVRYASEDSPVPPWQVETMLRHFTGLLDEVKGLTATETLEASLEAIDLMLAEAQMSATEINDLVLQVYGEVLPALGA